MMKNSRNLCTFRISFYLCVGNSNGSLCMNKKEQDIAYFLSFCIEQYKEQHELTGAEAADVLSRYGVLEYLEQHYESLHSQSKQWIMEDIEQFIRLRKEEQV